MRLRLRCRLGLQLPEALPGAEGAPPRATWMPNKLVLSVGGKPQFHSRWVCHRAALGSS